MMYDFRRLGIAHKKHEQLCSWLFFLFEALSFFVVTVNCRYVKK